MVDDLVLVLTKEWKSFRGSDRSVFYIYGIMALMYSLVFASQSPQAGLDTPVLWWVLFSVVVSGTFANLIFIAERTTGQLEIFLTSGISRDSVVLGKAAFSMIMSVVMAALPLALARVWALGGFSGHGRFNWWGPMLYLGASFMNSSSTAWLSLRMNNPRFAHFLNFLVVSAAVGAYAAARIPEFVLLLGFLVAGGWSLLRALRAIHSERVVQSVNL